MILKTLAEEYIFFFNFRDKGTKKTFKVGKVQKDLASER
jgi:hypothetical protein